MGITKLGQLTIKCSPDNDKLVKFGACPDPTPTPTPQPATATPTPTPTSAPAATATPTPTPTPAGSPATATPTPTPTSTPACYTYSIQNNDQVQNLTYRYYDCDGNLQEDNIVLADSGTPDFCAQQGTVTRQGGTNSWVLTVEATSCTVGSTPTATPTPTPTSAPAATATPTPTPTSAPAATATPTPTPAPATSTPTPTPTSAPTLYSVTLEYGTVDCATVCNNYGSNPSGTFWLDEANFGIASKIYQSNNVNDPANAWFYTDGTECRAADGSGNLGSSSSC